MKKIITTIFLASATLVGFSQSLVALYEGHDVSSDTIDVYVAPNTRDNITDILVSNESGTTVDSVIVKRTIYTLTSMDTTQFCWAGFCYPVDVNFSYSSVAIPSGDTIAVLPDGFHTIMNIGPGASTRLVDYKFYDKHNTSSAVHVTIRYSATLGINEISKINGSISNAYPNPASSFVSVKYSMNEYSQKGRIVFYDVLGKSVKEVVLNDKQGIATITTSDLNTGIYFYKFIIDDKAISTKKLVISSR